MAVILDACRVATTATTADRPSPSGPSSTDPQPTGPASPATTGGEPFGNCAAAEAAGVAPLHVGDPGYSTSLDGDLDGIACE